MGYHGCDHAIAEAVFAGGEIKPSANSYDWLGTGIYFWEDDQDRALEWAEEGVVAGRLTRPAVIGAVIDLGNCLDLTTRANLALLRISYEGLALAFETAGKSLPVNRDAPSRPPGNQLLRELDNAVIQHVHKSMDEEGIAPFDTVRGLFIEGDALYPGGGFFSHTHSQIAVRNLTMIRGLFRPIA